MGKIVSALLNIDSAAKQILHSSTRSMHAINYIKTLKKVFYLYIYIKKKKRTSTAPTCDCKLILLETRTSWYSKPSHIKVDASDELNKQFKRCTKAKMALSLPHCSPNSLSWVLLFTYSLLVQVICFLISIAL